MAWFLRAIAVGRSSSLARPPIRKKWFQRRGLLFVTVSMLATVSACTGSGAVLPSGTGPLADNGRGSCHEMYSASSIENRSFAFDGTVTRVGSSLFSDRGDVKVDLDVTEWFRGGSDRTITLEMPRPVSVKGADGEEYLSYGVGTRLLVSGEPRWGGGATRDAIAWGCGFTRYFDSATAAIWRLALQ